mgnify:CR=1 FL=1
MALPPKQPRANAAVVPKKAPAERDESTVAVHMDEVAAQVARTRPVEMAPQDFLLEPVQTVQERLPRPELFLEPVHSDGLGGVTEPIAEPLLRQPSPKRSASAPALQPVQAVARPAPVRAPVTPPAPLPAQRTRSAASAVPALSRPASTSGRVMVFSPADAPPPPEEPSAADEPAVRTQFAQRALLLSEDFNVTLAKTPMPGLIPRVAKMIPPDVQSTGGGKQARESIVLTPSAGTGAAITCGFVDVAKGVGEIRTLAYLARARGGTLGFSPADYDALVDRVVTYLRTQDIRVMVVDESLGQGPGFGTRKASWAVPAMVGAGLVVLGLAAFLLR